MLNPAWIEWAKNQVVLLKDGGCLVYPLDGKGVVYRLDKTNHQLVTLCEHPDYHGSEVDTINREVFKVIGYSTIRSPNTPTNLKDTIAKIQSEGGLGLIDSKVIVGLSQIFSTKPQVIERMLHEATGNKTPINPVTIRGYHSHIDLTPRSLAIGRLWLTSDTIGEGQHRFDSTKPTENMDRTMQFVIFEGTTNILAFMIADENDFIPLIKAFRNKVPQHFTLTGTATRAVAEKRDIVFSRLGENLLVNIHLTDKNSPILSTVFLDYAKFDRGLDHLFVKGELTVPENN